MRFARSVAALAVAACLASSLGPAATRAGGNLPPVAVDDPAVPGCNPPNAFGGAFPIPEDWIGTDKNYPGWFPLFGNCGPLANDTDPDGDPLTIVPVGQPAHGQAQVLPGGTWLVYKPHPDFSTLPGDQPGGQWVSDTVQYRAFDGQAYSNVASYTFWLAPVNDAPSFTPGPSQVTGWVGEGPVSIPWATDVKAGPPNESYQTVNFEVSVSSPGAPNMFAVPPSIDASGNLTFTPGSQAGLATVTVDLHDNGGLEDYGQLGNIVPPADTSPTVQVQIAIEWQSPGTPSVVDDSAVVYPDTTLCIPVLANDSSPLGRPLSVTAVETPSMGTATISTPGCGVLYSPSLGASGPDAFAYTASDDQGRSASATVNLTLLASPSVSAFTAPASPANTATLAYSLQFSENVTGPQSTDFSVSGTGSGTCVVGTPTGGPAAYTVVLSSCSDGTISLTLGANTVSDGALNLGPTTTATAATVTQDRTPPAVTLTAPTSPTNTASLSYSVSASEAVTDLTASDFTVTGTAIGCSVGAPTGGPSSYTVVLSSCGEGTVILTLKANSVADAATNTGPSPASVAATVTVDRTGPAVVITPPSTPTSATSLTYSLAFSEPLAPGSLTAGDFGVTGTGSSTCSVGSPAGSGASWIVTLSSCSEGTVILTLNANGVADAAGNTGPSAPASGGTVTADRTAPSVSGLLLTPSTTTAGGSVTVTATIADPSGVSTAQVSVNGGGWTTMTPVDGAYGGVSEPVTAGITAPMSVGPYPVCVRTIDSLANTSAGNACATLTVAPPSSDSTLSSLAVSGCTLAPPFAPATTVHACPAPNAVVSTTVTAVPANAGATLASRSGGGLWSSLTSGVASGGIPLGVGANTVEVRVTAQDGVSISYYTVAVTRAAAATAPVPASGAPETIPVTADPALGALDLTVGSAPSGGSVTVEQAPDPAATTPFTVDGSTVIVTITAPGTTGLYTVCMNGVSPARLWHYVASAWADITTAYVGGKVCGTTATLSPFASAPKIDTSAPVFSKPLTVSVRTGVSLPSASRTSPVLATLLWTAADEALGSGLDHYTLQQSVNGGAWSTIALAAPLSTSASVSMPTSGSVAYQVTACDAKANCSTSATGTLTPRIVEHTSTAVKFKLTWTLYRLSSLSGGSDKYSRTRNAYATYTFNGLGIGFVSMRGTGRGWVKIYLDGVYRGRVNLYRGSTQARYLAWQWSSATRGMHTLKLLVEATRGKPRVDFDAFVVIK
jgi:hypothetical protein